MNKLFRFLLLAAIAVGLWIPNTASAYSGHRYGHYYGYRGHYPHRYYRHGYYRHGYYGPRYYPYYGYPYTYPSGYGYPYVRPGVSFSFGF